MEAERAEEWVGVSLNKRKQCLLGTIEQCIRSQTVAAAWPKTPASPSQVKYQKWRGKWPQSSSPSPEAVGS